MSEELVKFVSARQWAKAAKERHPEASVAEQLMGDAEIADLGVRLSFNAEVEMLKATAPKPEGRQMLIAISSAAVDRDGDTIAVEGWKLEQYRKNPVVLFGHRYFNNEAPVVGRSLSEFVHKKKLKSLMEFTPQGMVPLADTLYGLYSEGYMNAASVGFIPLNWSFPEDEKREWGVDFLEQELLEYSLVPVPANSEALSEQFDEARGKGIDTLPYKEHIEKMLDAWGENKDRNLWIPKSTLKAYRDAADPAQATSEQVPDDTGKTKADCEARFSNPDDLVAEPEIVEDKGVIGYGTAHSDGTPVAPKDEEWDGSMQVAAAEVDDLKVMSTWVDSENSDQKGAYKLPHHKAAGDHSLVWRGVTAAMGALMGARGGVDIPDGDRRGVYNHLAKHYRDDFDEEPPEFAEQESVAEVPEPVEEVAETAEEVAEIAEEIVTATDWTFVKLGDLTHIEGQTVSRTGPPAEEEAATDETVTLSDDQEAVLSLLGIEVGTGGDDEAEQLVIVDDAGDGSEERSQSDLRAEILGEVFTEEVEAALTHALGGKEHGA